MEKKNLIITGILMLVFCSAPCGAQETSDTITCSPEADKEILISRIRSTRQDEDATSHAAYPITEDYVTSMPWTGWGMGGWDLHEGLNAQVVSRPLHCEAENLLLFWVSEIAGIVFERFLP